MLFAALALFCSDARGAGSTRSPERPSLLRAVPPERIEYGHGHLRGLLREGSARLGRSGESAGQRALSLPPAFTSVLNCMTPAESLDDLKTRRRNYVLTIDARVL